MARDGWTAEKVQEFGQLRGQRITSWTAVEMALREESSAGGPQFEDPAVPCLQLDTLGAFLDDGAFVTIGTYEDDAGCGLWLRRTATAQSLDWASRTGVYRTRELSELPTGEIDSVATFLDDEVLAEVVLHIQGRPLRWPPAFTGSRTARDLGEFWLLRGRHLPRSRRKGRYGHPVKVGGHRTSRDQERWPG